MPRNKITNTQLKFNIQESLKKELQEEAVSRGISLAAFIRLILSQYIRNRKGGQL